MRFPVLLIPALFFIAFYSANATNLKPSFGLAMHGAPKYAASAVHLDYANPDAPKGGTLQMAAIGTFDTLNPYSIKGKAAEGLNLVYDRLMGRVWDEPFTLYPLIAESVDVAPDRSAATFYLNPKARFQDGSAITAEDVIFSFQTLKESGRPNMRRIYRLVDKVETRGTNGVYFSFGPGYDRETVMILAMMPILSKAYWSGKIFDKTTLAVPLLSGPYKIASVDPGRRIVYQRDPDYWAKDLLENKGHYNFTQVIYDYYRDDTVALEAFKAGDLNLRREWDAGKWSTGYVFPAATSKNVALDALPHGRPEKVRSFIFNIRRAPFDDIRVRQALNLLFDFDWANQNLFHGQYKRIASYFPNSELAATGVPSSLELKILAPWKDKLSPSVFQAAWQPPVTATADQRRANQRRADALLKEAGWIVQNGVRTKNGKPFVFEIILSAPEDEKIALHFKRSLERMGIKPVIRVMDSAAYLGRLNAYDYDMTLYYWLSTLSPGTEQILYWGCAAAKEPARWNYAGICDPAVDSLANGIAQATSREGLVSTVRALDRVLMSGFYMIPLYYTGVDHVAYWAPVQRPAKTPLYGPVLESWWAAPAKKP